MPEQDAVSVEQLQSDINFLKQNLKLQETKTIRLSEELEGANKQIDSLKDLILSLFEKVIEELR